MDYINGFSLYLSTDRGLSKNTVKSYVNDIEDFFNFVTKAEEEITSHDIRAYIHHLTEIGRAKSTIHRVISSLKSFFSYLVDIERLMKESPAKDIKRPKKDKTLPKAVSEEAIRKLIEIAATKGMKHRLLVELLYGLGARVSEVVSLRVEDFDMEESYVRLYGKGGKERYSPIHPGAISLLKEYLHAYRIKEGFIFPKRGNSGGHMSRVSAYLSVKGLADQVGINPDLISPHVFRHSFATHMLDNGCDMALVQEYLGHEDISTTKIYAKVTRANKAATFKKFHPLANEYKDKSIKNSLPV